MGELYVFGSTVRDETQGLASDDDVLLVLDDANEEAVANRPATEHTT